MGTSQSSLATAAKSKAKGEGGRKSSNDETIPALKRSSVSVMKEIYEENTADETLYHQDADFEAICEVVSEEESESEDESEDEVELEERLRILEDARLLKQLAGFFLHPEEPVESSEAVTRCFFDRASAPERVSKEEADEQAAILADAKTLKASAVDYAHPERPVTASVGSRCYFDRASAPSVEEAEERDEILADCAALKQAATDYLHPERPVTMTDMFACGRNYYSRPSADHIEDSDERERVLADAMALKQLAVDYHHPEVSVTSTDPFACARNYFSRASADEYDDPEKAQVLEDAVAFKKLAVDFRHPERPVKVTDPCACGRNYFDRPSAVQYEDAEDAAARAQIMEDIKALNVAAADYLHPERPVTSSVNCARNYFDRAGAPDIVEDAEELNLIMEDLKALKQAAVHYLHPELPVKTTDPFACGRSFFSRPSAAEQEDLEGAAEAARVMADAKALKQVAVDYLHPELPIVSDGFACGRNYFTRPAAQEQEDPEDAAEAALVMAEAKALKQNAVDFLHPERPVVSDGFACGRNFFSRASALEQEDAEDASERARVLADAKALKQAAVVYMHPELPVVTTDPTATGRNFFDRPAHTLHDQMIHTFPPHEDEDQHHEHIDHFGMDEDLVFNEFRNEITAPIEAAKPKALGSDEVGSNLSRSPSSIMLFNEEYE